MRDRSPEAVRRRGDAAREKERASFLLHACPRCKGALHEIRIANRQQVKCVNCGYIDWSRSRGKKIT